MDTSHQDQAVTAVQAAWGSVSSRMAQEVAPAEPATLPKEREAVFPEVGLDPARFASVLLYDAPVSEQVPWI